MFQLVRRLGVDGLRFVSQRRVRLTILACIAALPFLGILVWFVWSSMEVPEDTANRVDNIAKLLKYVGLILTAVLTGWSVLMETVVTSTEPSNQVGVTPQRKIFVSLLYITGLVTAASAAIQDKADDRVRHFEQSNGNEIVRKELEKTLLGDLKPALEKQLDGQRDALIEQTKSIGGVADSIKESGRFMSTLVTKTGGQLEFASHRFKNLSVDLLIEDAKFDIPGEPDTALGRKLLQFRDEACITRSLPTPRTTDRQCKAAQTSFNQWYAAKLLRTYLDRSGKLELNLEFTFVGFEIEGGNGPCRMPSGEFSDSDECLELFLTSTGNTGERTELSYDENLAPVGSSLDLGHSLRFTFADEDGFANAFSEDGISGRDALFGALSVSLCNPHYEGPLASPVHAGQLRSRSRFRLTVSGTDESTSREIPASYELSEYYLALKMPISNCVSAYYNENIAPKQATTYNGGSRVSRIEPTR